MADANRNRLGLLAGLLLALAHGPLAVRYLIWLWGIPHYQFFPALLVGAGILGHTGWSRVESMNPGGRREFAALIALDLALLSLGIVVDSPWLGMVATLVGLLAATWGLGGAALVRAVLPAWLLLWLLIRPPLGLDIWLVQSLQDTTSRAASAVLDVLGVVHLLTGNVVEIADRRLLVEEACSGVRSFFAALSVALFFELWAGRRWWQVCGTIASVPFWVLCGNVLRVVLTTLLCLAGWSADEGFLHTLLGFVSFAVVMGLVASTDQLLVHLSLWRVKADVWIAERQRPPRAGARPRPAWGRSPLASGALALMAGLLTVSQSALAIAAWRSTSNAPDVVESLESVGADSLPASVGAWNRGEYTTQHRENSSEYGEFSKIWHYAGPDGGAIASLDFPFRGWHELIVCYRNQGWVVRGRRDLAAEDPKRSGLEVELEQPELGRHGYLLYDVFDARHQPLPVGLRSALSGGLDIRLSQWRRFSRLWSPDPDSAQQDIATYQAQVLIEDMQPISAERRAAAAELLRALHRAAEGTAAAARERGAP